MAIVRVAVGRGIKPAERKTIDPATIAKGTATAGVRPPSGQRAGDSHVVCSACSALNWIRESEKSSPYFTCWSCAYVGRRPEATARASTK